jgi:hypothetical protein
MLETKGQSGREKCRTERDQGLTCPMPVAQRFSTGPGNCSLGGYLAKETTDTVLICMNLSLVFGVIANTQLPLSRLSHRF